MTVPNYDPADPGVVEYDPGKSAPVEAKTVWATIAALLVGALVSVGNLALADADLMGATPPWAQTIVTLLGPPLLTYGAAYQAKHTARPDLPPSTR